MDYYTLYLLGCMVKMNIVFLIKLSIDFVKYLFLDYISNLSNI